MCRQRLFSVQETAVADFESVVELLCPGLLRRFVDGCVGEGRTIRLPRKLLNRRGALGQLKRISAGHVEYEYLIVFVPVRRKKGDAVSVRRPSGKPDVLASMGE